MSEATVAAVRPLFYNNVEPLDPARHGGLMLDRTTGYAFAGAAQAVPIGLSELRFAAQHYPIVFTAADQPMLVALLSCQSNRNLFVRADGTWLPDAYIPAYARAFPFIFLSNDRGETLHFAVETNAACLATGQGIALFDADKPAEALNEAVRFCAALRRDLLAANEFSQALQQVGVLKDEAATISFPDGNSLRVTGFRIIDQERLNQIEDDTFLDWRRKGWVAAAYAQVNSTGAWRRVVTLTNGVSAHSDA
jgi:SapC